MRYTIYSMVICLLWLIPLVAHSSPAQDGPPGAVHQAGKEPLYRTTAADHIYDLPESASARQRCVDQCLRQNQQAAMGYEAIVESCRQECAFEEALVLARSGREEDHLAGSKSLCDSQDMRAVQPLITALQRDVTERTGVWAWIIPALGSSQDSTAVPALIATLTLMDEDWLGREMSARALGDIGDPSALPALLAAAWRADTRDAAIEALATFQDRRVVPVMISALDPDEEQQTRETAAVALHNLGSLAVPEIIQAFSDYSPEYPQTGKRLVLCRLLGTSKDQHALDILLRDTLTDPDATIRSCAEQYSRSQQK